MRAAEETVVDQAHSITFTWRRFGTSATSAIRQTLPWAVIGVALAVVLVVLGRPGAALFVVALAASRLTFLIAPVPRGEVIGQSVSFSRQRFPRNRAMWIAVAVGVMAVSMLVQAATGELPVAPALLLGAAFAVACVVFLVVALRFGGPIRVSAGGVSLSDGRTFGFATDRIVVVVASQGEPCVELTTVAPGIGESTTAQIAHGVYGIDANTFVSAVGQLRSWSVYGRPVSGHEINAMLTARAPESIAVGQSVELTVAV